jgi:hypothetical protein
MVLDDEQSELKLARSVRISSSGKSVRLWDHRSIDYLAVKSVDCEPSACFGFSMSFIIAFSDSLIAVQLQISVDPRWSYRSWLWGAAG